MAAVLFLDDRGSGKATTAVAFYSLGNAVFVDDIARVRVAESGNRLQTASTGLRLLEDSLQLMGFCAIASGFQRRKHVCSMKRAASAAQPSSSRRSRQPGVPAPSRPVIGSPDWPYRFVEEDLMGHA
jgi:hypothetical protein